MSGKTESEEKRSGEVRGPGMNEHAHSHCVSTEVEFEYDLDLAPRNQKLIILTTGGVAMTGMFVGTSKDDDIMAFFPLPKRNHEVESQKRKEGKYPWTKRTY